MTSGDKLISMWFNPMGKRDISMTEETSEKAQPMQKRRKINGGIVSSLISKSSQERMSSSSKSQRAGDESTASAISSMNSNERNSKKCSIFWTNGHSILIQNVYGTASEEKCVNVLDMGLKSLFSRRRVYKDAMYKSLLDGWSKETAIPKKHLAVYHFTERKNKTMRTNTQIEVDLTEEFKGDGDWTDDEIKRHLVPTDPKMMTISSIYHRIGNMKETMRSFVFLDNRRITTLEGAASEQGADTVLVALKYFDILAQKMYFVDWLKIKNSSITFADVSNYIESKLIPETMANGGCLQSLYELNTKMSEFEAKINGDEQPKYQFYDETYPLFCPIADPVGLVTSSELEDPVDYFFNGDIFVFQINPFHPYFSALNPAKIGDPQNVMIQGNLNHQRLPLHFQHRIQEFEKRGVPWYCTADEFIVSPIHFTDIEIEFYDKSVWDKQWSKALIHQYLSANDVSEENMGPRLRRKITRSIHKWKANKVVTYGMIRKRLGSYYNIKPEHFEIWLPQRSCEDQWNYGSSGRGKWDQPLWNIMKQKPEWQKRLPLRFEIVAYDVKVLDEMTNHPNSEKINGLALFMCNIVQPSFPLIKAMPTKMKLIYHKNWTAQDFIQHILNQIIENPVFLLSLFRPISEYVRKFEMENRSEGRDYVNTQIVLSLSPKRFMITNEHTEKPMEKYYMYDQYRMPDSYSNVRYTDFTVRLLAKNDPLVLHTENIFQLGNITTYGLWVHIYRRPQNNKSIRQMRVVIEGGESLKDLILRDIWPYMVLNKLHSLSPTNYPKGKDQDKKSENEDDLMKSIIESKVKVFLANRSDFGAERVLQIPMGQNDFSAEDFGKRLIADMWLRVYLPELRDQMGAKDVV